MGEQWLAVWGTYSSTSAEVKRGVHLSEAAKHALNSLKLKFKMLLSDLLSLRGSHLANGTPLDQVNLVFIRVLARTGELVRPNVTSLSL